MSKPTAKVCEKKPETSVALIVFNGVPCEVRAYAVPVSFNSLYMNQVPDTVG